jgi:hypothetical protein
MSFADDIARIPYNPRGTDAAGFLAPMFRTVGHLLMALNATADETLREHTNDEEILTELRDARTHWDAVNWNEALSTATATTVTAFGGALGSAAEEFPNWDEQTRIRNIRDLANRSAAIASVLDRELVGLRDSDPGYAL